MYDPVTARFLQEDTYFGSIDDPLSLNLYTYCHNEPIMYTDPTGHARGDWWDFSYFGENFKAVYVDRLRQSVLEDLTLEEYNNINSYQQGITRDGKHITPQTHFFKTYMYDPESATPPTTQRNTFQQNIYDGNVWKARVTGFAISGVNAFLVQPAIFIGTTASYIGGDFLGFSPGAGDRTWSSLQNTWSGIQSNIERKVLTTNDEVNSYGTFRAKVDVANEIYGLFELGRGGIQGYRNLRDLQLPKNNSFGTTAVDAGTGTKVDIYKGQYEIKPTIVRAYEEMGKKADAGVGNGEKLPGRNGAFRQAKRDANIPVNQKPQEVKSVEMREAEYEGGHVIKDENGNIIYTREYTFTNKNGESIVIQEHSAGHTKGNQGPHFNVRPADDTRTGKVPGTKDHYPFNK